MCDPVAAVAIGSMVLSTAAQQQQASAQEKAARASERVQQAAVDEQSRQTVQQTTEQMSERAKQAMQDQARLEVVAGERGVSGASVDANAQEIEMNRATDSATLASNLGNKMAQTALDRQGISANTTSRLNNIKQPDWMGTALTVAGMGYKSASAAGYFSSSPTATATSSTYSLSSGSSQGTGLKLK